ncbi:MAG: L,D-transpeptidase [Methylocystis sp.]|nr:MAG: L,D-transpeptidase [Methylocystis sp.]
MVFSMFNGSKLFRLAASTSIAALLLGAGVAVANPAVYGAPGYGGGYYQQQSPLGGGLIEALVGDAPGPVRYAAPPAPHAYPGARQTAAYAPQPLETQRAIDPMYMRAEVDYDGSERPGTIVVDTPNKFLYYVNGRGRATRYGIGVGRPGFEWSGVKTISRKAEWPDWTPPAEMLARRPDLPRHMEGGPANPLGARAMYLGSSLYRIHGTNEPHTIGQNVSSGCIRMMNDDVVDLYNRTPVGTRVIVR